MSRKLFISLCVLGWASSACLADWPQFRGPEGNGISTAHGLPLNWSETQNVKWKTATHGRAWSSPVVFGKEIWLTTADEKGTQLGVICMDLETGKIIHDQKIFDVEVPQSAIDFNSFASPTPVIEEGRLYVSWGSPGLACIDTKTAKTIWERRDFICNHYRGAGSSVTVYGDLLFHNFDGSDHQFVVALDKHTGKTVWRTERSVDFKDIQADGKPDRAGDWRKAFTTPRIFPIGGKPTLFSQGSKSAYTYDLATGQELWRAEYAVHTSSTTAVFGDGTIYLCTGNPKGELWALNPNGHGVLPVTNVLWKIARNVPTRPSLLFLNGLIFMVDDGGIASCIEAKNGQEIWRERIGGNYSASPLYAEGHIYFFSEEGKCTVIAAAREFKIIAQNQLGDGFMASAAVEWKALILRSRTQLYRVEEK